MTSDSEHSLIHDMAQVNNTSLIMTVNCKQDKCSNFLITVDPLIQKFPLKTKQ